MLPLVLIPFMSYSTDVTPILDTLYVHTGDEASRLADKKSDFRAFAPRQSLAMCTDLLALSQLPV